MDEETFVYFGLRHWCLSVLIHETHTSLGTGHPLGQSNPPAAKRSLLVSGYGGRHQRVCECRKCAMAKTPRHLPTRNLIPCRPLVTPKGLPTAMETAEPFNHVFWSFGIPKYIVWDKGTAFTTPKQRQNQKEDSEDRPLSPYLLRYPPEPLELLPCMGQVNTELSLTLYGAHLVSELTRLPVYLSLLFPRSLLFGGEKFHGYLGVWSFNV